MYGIIRQLDIKRRDWSRLLAVLVVLGLYLACTGACEVAGRWSLVFPRYIANPDLGIHFGRARGPELNAVSLGLYVTACFLCMDVVQFRNPPFVPARACRRSAADGGRCPAHFYTLDVDRARRQRAGRRGVQIPRRWRLPALLTAALFGLLVVTASWGQLIGIKREGTVEDSEHSVDQRESFAYVSWQMFRDHPIFGVGFGRFYDRKLPYLSDRSQNFELESLRPLHHHNTLLSVLTETGLVGFAAFVGVFAVWIRTAWRLTANSKSASWVHAQGLLMLAIITNFLCSAVFHDLTLMPSQELLLFIFAAITVNLHQRESLATEGESSRTGWHALGLCTRRGAVNATVRAEDSGRANPVNLFGIQISRVSMEQAVATILSWCREPRGDACRYIVTPNTDHAVLFQQRGDLRAAYQEASLVLADGTPLVWAARLLAQALPERVAGSDLVPRLFEASGTSLRVFLLGAEPGVAELAASQIAHQWSGVHVVGTYSPPIGFENDAAENDRIISAINSRRAGFDDCRPRRTEARNLGPSPPSAVTGQGRHLRRCDHRFPRRPPPPLARVDASCRLGMALPTGRRAAPPGRPLRPRCLDTSAACLSAVASSLCLTTYSPCKHRGYIRLHACECFGGRCRWSPRLSLGRLRQYVVWHPGARPFRRGKFATRLVLRAVGRFERHLSRPLAFPSPRSACR